MPRREIGPLRALRLSSFVFALLPLLSSGWQYVPRVARAGAVAARNEPPLVMMAKKGGGKKGGKGKGKKGGKGGAKSGFDWASSFELKPFESAGLRSLAELIVSSYQSRTGTALSAEILSANDLPKALWNAPFACMVMGEAPKSEPPADADAAEDAVEGDEAAEVTPEAPSEAPLEAPSEVCLYANVAALEAHGLESAAYGELIGAAATLPASWGGESKLQSDYSKKVKAAKEPFTLTGKRWLLEKMAVVDGKLGVQRLGVAYFWEEWETEDGSLCAPGGVRGQKPMTQEELEAAATAQALEVRRLKEEEGLGNKDSAVVDAVQELLRLKALVEEA